MKRITSLVLVSLAGVSSIAAAQEPMFNPLAMLSPAPSPMMGYGSPWGGYGNPMAGYGSPLGGLNSLNTLGALASLGLIAAPLVAPLAPNLISPLGQVGYPAMQMAPNLMSYGHYSQYGAGPFGGNPYLRPSLPNPMAPPAFSPSMPTLPFSPTQGTLPLPFGAPAPGYGSSPYAAPVPALPFLSGPGLSPAPGLLPGMAPATAMAPPGASNPWGAPAAPAPAPAPAASPAPGAANPWLMMVPAPAAPAPAPAPAKAEPKPVAPEAGMAPMDPAVFLQMLMKPMEAVAPVQAPAPAATPAAK